MSPTIQERRPIRLRHVRPVTAAELAAAAFGVVPGAVKVLERYFVAEATLDGPDGWVSGSYELRLQEEGRFTIRLPNRPGGDGVEHADRFAVIADPAYEAGDEWIEVWDGPPALSSEPLFVGTPTDAVLTDAAIELSGFDALELMKTVHETAAGFWAHAPRDVFESYTQAWVADLADDFSVAAANLPTARWTRYSEGTYGPNHGTAIRSDGKLRLVPAAASGGATIAVESVDPIALNAPSDGSPSSAQRFRDGYRVETSIRLTLDRSGGPVAGSAQASFGLARGSWADAGGSVGTATGYLFTCTVGRTYEGVWTVYWTTGGNLAGDAVTHLITQIIPASESASAIDVSLVFEIRDRWVYCYANGQLGAVLPRWLSTDDDVYVRWYCFATAGGGVTYNGSYLDVENIVVRSRRPFLLRGADRGSPRLPGVPQAGGLVATYFDDRDLFASQIRFGTDLHVNHLLKPTRQPAARAITPTVDHSNGALPAGVPAEHHSVRWTGAVYLDLSSAKGVLFRIANLDDGATLWVGPTRSANWAVKDWAYGGARTAGPSADMRTHLGTTEAGWYPIVLEYFQGASGGSVRLEWAPVTGAVGGSVGAWTTVPATALSPQGIYEASVKGDSHYEQLQEQGRTFGLQWTLEPRSLESGLFPGELRPRIRVGVDTDRVITLEDLVDGKPTRTLAARDVVQGLILDAAGIATDGAQLTLEQLDYDELGRHLLIHEDLVSLSDITIPAVLKARATTLQTLRSTALEDVAFRPRGSSELVDLFPLAGALARLAWTPGLGVRLAFPRLRLEDKTPRQLIATQRAITPAGIGPPEVSFRQRPRSPRAALRALARSFSATQRQYQGQITSVQGNLAAKPTPQPYMPDGVSRAPWPADSSSVVGGTLIVHVKGDASAWNILVNGVDTNVDISAAGRHDISGYVRRDSTNGRCYVELTGGTGLVEYQLELKVQI